MTDLMALLLLLTLAVGAPAVSYVLATRVIRYTQRKFSDD